MGGLGGLMLLVWCRGKTTSQANGRDDSYVVEMSATQKDRSDEFFEKNKRAAERKKREREKQSSSRMSQSNASQSQSQDAYYSGKITPASEEDYQDIPRERERDSRGV